MDMKNLKVHIANQAEKEKNISKVDQYENPSLLIHTHFLNWVSIWNIIVPVCLEELCTVSRLTKGAGTVLGFDLFPKSFSCILSTNSGLNSAFWLITHFCIADWFGTVLQESSPVLLAAHLLREFMSSIVVINCEDGTEYAQIFYTEQNMHRFFILKMQEVRDRKMKDKNWKAGKYRTLYYN